MHGPADRSSTTSGDSSAPLHSTLATDPEMAELVQFFLGELDQRLAEVAAARDAADGALLMRLVHQLKGAGGGYGYPAITSKAAEVEVDLRAVECDVHRVGEKIDDLVALCRRAIAARSSS